MRRIFPTMLGLAMALTACSTEARAQWGYGNYGGYGGYGWGGWGGAGSTFQGSVAQGLGMMYMGEGSYNKQTAIANSINADTMMRWNQFVYEGQKEATRRYFARRNAEFSKDREAYNTALTRLNENPSRSDIERGDALNAILDQLNDPRIHTSTLRSIDVNVDAKLIREIPFTNASEAITISLEQLKDATRWPRALRDARFAPDQKAFEDAVVQARKEDEEGEIAPETLDKVRQVATDIKVKLGQMPLDDRAETREAQNFVKTLFAMTRMLAKPKVEQVLSELRKFEKTTVGNLLGFMRTFNLRFGPATTPGQRNAYNELFSAMDQVRDKIVAEAKLDDTVTEKAKTAKLHDFFSAMEMDHVEGKKPAATTPPPAPQP
ncbi:hypothetical protein [Paludisphaera borealis]|uniref:Uncharacterized protein n=1 Tax=Paludisphaera borealis TaxID=1387353 RepID=A0A1U7CUG2_9BACT|nr:hypothetical protein [Paludisphaera borealis]APW62584.1 hypothetical protein BSF38_04132 [Paludisphaera borealis]